MSLNSRWTKKQLIKDTMTIIWPRFSTTWDSSLALETKQCFYFSIIVGREHFQFFKFAQIMTKNGFLALKWYWQSHCMRITWNVNGRTKLKICRSLNDIFSKTFYFGRNFSHFTDLYTKFKCFYYYSKFLILLMFCLLFIDCLF